MSFALLSDAPVTSSQIAANPIADGANLYIPSLDYSDPATGNNNITTAKIHMMKSANAGVTWAEQDASHTPQVYDTVSAVYGSPAIPPFLVIDSVLFFDAPVPGYEWPPYQVIPFTMADVPGFDDYGNDTIEINLLEYGSSVAGFPVSLVVSGNYGVLFDEYSIAPPVAAALNAQLVGLGIDPTVLRFGVGPGAISFSYTGFSEVINDGSLVLLTDFTGSSWAIAATGNMLAPYDPAILGRCELHIFDEELSEITIFNVVGVDPYLNPIPVLFNTFSPPAISNHVVYIAYIGLDQTVNIARYNTLTDTWMTTIVGGPPVTMIVYDSSLGANLALRFYAVVKVRSNGDIVIAMAVGATVGSSGNYPNTYWAVYSGGSWGSATLITSANLNVPCAAVIDASDNVAFIINMGGGNSGGNPFVSTFCVNADNSTVALANVDASPDSYAVIPLSQGNLFQGIQGAFLQASGVILLVLGYDVSGTPDAKAYEITMTSLLAGGSWTKMARAWVNGVDQFAGAVDATFWNNQFQAIVGQGSNPACGLWDTNVGIGTGSASGGTADTTFSASVAVLATTGGSTVNRIIYSTMAIVLPGGNLGIAYSYLDFINYEPDYYTRFALFSDTLFTASCNSPASGSIGGSYAHTFTSTGGIAPVTWAKTSGSFPTGLTLDPMSGVLSGILSATGTFSFALTATDADGNTATVSCSIKITVGFVASCGSGGAGLVGDAYTQTMTEAGGVSPFTWSILSGMLPPGTTLDTSAGVISGTLTTAGRFYWTAKVVDVDGAFAIVSCRAQICPADV